MLSGLGAKAFDQIIDNIISVHAMFSRHFSENAMEDWTPSSYMDHTVISIANRYFTEKRLCPFTSPVPFHPTVDPRGTLQNMTGDKLVHTQENHVDYYEIVHPKENINTYVNPLKNKATSLTFIDLT